MFIFQLVLNFFLFYIFLNIFFLISLKNKPKFNYYKMIKTLYWPFLLAFIFTLIDYLRIYVLYKIILVIGLIIVFVILSGRKK